MAINNNNEKKLSFPFFKENEEDLINIRFYESNIVLAKTNVDAQWSWYVDM